MERAAARQARLLGDLAAGALGTAKQTHCLALLSCAAGGIMQARGCRAGQTAHGRHARSSPGGSDRGKPGTHWNLLADPGKALPSRTESSCSTGQELMQDPRGTALPCFSPRGPILLPLQPGLQYSCPILQGPVHPYGCSQRGSVLTGSAFRFLGPCTLTPSRSAPAESALTHAVRFPRLCTASGQGGSFAFMGKGVGLQQGSRAESL